AGGWNLEAMRNTGADPAHRGAILRERVLAMKEIWTKDEAEFHGRYVDFDPIWCWPKPVQRPNPPVLLGSDGPRALERVVDYADGWAPYDAHRRPGRAEQIVARAAELQELAKAAGR